MRSVCRKNPRKGDNMNENQNNEMIPEEVKAEQNAAKETPEVTETAPQPQSEPMPEPKTVAFAPDTAAKPPKSTNSGIKVFVSLVALVAVICICLTVGYVAGRSYILPDNNDSTPVGVVSRPTDENAMSATEIYEQVSKSVVGIYVYNQEGPQSTASGVVFKNGYIITNDHIYADIPNPCFIIIDSEGNEYNAYYVAGDTRSDVAVLRTEAELPAAEFGNSNEVLVGEDAMAIGYTAGPYEDSVFTFGTISSKTRRVTGANTSYSTKMIQTDSAINPGSSGGALVNVYGQVIGITSIKTAGSYYDSMGYAIPSNTVVDIANKLIEYGYVKGRAVMGVSYTENTTVDYLVSGKRVGIVIQSITAGGPLAGKNLSVGDVIVAINDVAVTQGNDVLDIIECLEAGDQIILTVYTTSNQTKTVTVTLGEDKGGSSYVTTK